jgi:hypothetical protein
MRPVPWAATVDYSWRVAALGVLIFLAGSAATAAALRAAFASQRPNDLLWGALAPLLAVVALFGLYLAGAR